MGSPPDGSVPFTAGEENSVSDVTAAGVSPAPVAPRHGDVDVLTRGAALGRYLVLEKLGEGGMGAVYAAFDQELDRRVALKVLNAEARPDGEGHARLLREARALAKLAHPNVVSLFDVLTVEGRVVLVMELVEGETLKAWSRSERRPWKETLGIFLAAGQGLVAAHDKGIIHRDFKPDNVLVGKDGRVRVADFGIARDEEEGPAPAVAAGARDEVTAADPTANVEAPTGASVSLGTASRNSHSLTAVGQVVGTPAYMAPEQVMGATADARTDQFSFCVALYEALVGHRPFGGHSLSARSKNALEGKFRPPDEDGRVPPWLVKVLQRGLSGNPASRYPSMAALLAALRADPTIARRRWALTAGAGLAVALSLVAGIRGFQQRGQLCKGGEQKLASRWGAAQRSSVRAALEQSKTPFAADAWRLVDETLQRYTSEWVQMHEDACLATRVRGEQSDQVLSLRMACLDERLEEVSAVSAVLAKADARVVERVGRTLESLAPLKTCADTRMLLSQFKLPSTPQQRAEVEKLRSQFTEGRVLRNAGKYPEGRVVARRALEAAQAQTYLPVRAEALVLMSELEDKLDDFKPSSAHALDGFAAALGTSQDLVAGRAALLLAAAESRQGRAPGARTWLTVARSLIQRVGGDGELEGLANNLEGSVLSEIEGRELEALETYKQGLARATAQLGPDHSITQILQDNLAVSYGTVGQHPLASAQFRALIARAQATRGKNHPFLRYPIHGLANSELQMGHWTEAREALEEFSRLENQSPQSILTAWRDDAWADFDFEVGDTAQAEKRLESAVPLFRKLAGDDFPQTLAAQAKLARARAALGHAPEALRELQKMKAKVDAAPERQNEAFLSVYLALANVLESTGEHARAHAVLAKVLEVQAKNRGQQGETTEALVLLGRILVSERRFPEALAPLESAIRTLEAWGGPLHPGLAEPLLALAEAHEELGHPEKARPLLERALARVTPQTFKTRLRAQVELALARNLERSGRGLQRAQELRELGRKDAARSGPMLATSTAVSP